MASYVITGVSRGIGLTLARQLLDLPAAEVGVVFAVTRSAPTAGLQALATQYPERLVHVLGSLDDGASIQKAAATVEAKLGGRGLDVLVNNAAMQSAAPGGTKTIPPEQLAQMFDVNVIGVHRVTAAFLPLLEKGGQKKVINLSSSLGSIAWAERFSFAPTQSYKVCKAALHMLNKHYAMDHADTDFTFLLVSPGWLKTDLGGDQAELDVEVGVTELKRIILNANKSQSGKFLNIHVPGYEKTDGQYDGGEIPW